MKRRTAGEDGQKPAPSREEIDLSLNEQLIVEYYSR